MEYRYVLSREERWIGKLYREKILQSAKKKKKKFKVLKSHDKKNATKSFKYHWLFNLELVKTVSKTMNTAKKQEEEMKE